jgi:hypothetical protein
MQDRSAVLITAAVPAREGPQRSRPLRSGVTPFASSVASSSPGAGWFAVASVVCHRAQAPGIIAATTSGMRERSNLRFTRRGSGHCPGFGVLASIETGQNRR